MTVPQLKDPFPDKPISEFQFFLEKGASASDHDFHIRTDFDRLLYLERKRTERSRRPFLLMLLNIENLLPPGAGYNLVKKLEKALSSCTRETDIRGWYEQGKIMGIIFTEMGAIEEIVKEKIFLKIQEKLCQALGSEAVERIRVAYHVFPEPGDGDPGGWFNFSLYPELIQKGHSEPIYLFLKRIIDFMGSLLGLIFLSPVFLLVALAIKLTSRGPVFFKQERVGQRGERFIFLKFRSMYENSDEKAHKDYITNFISSPREDSADSRNTNAPVVYKMEADRRVTPLGKFLRKTSLDELPQFINVLKGEMSLVGPRPPIPYECDLYDIWHRRRVLGVRPGITGLWQVEGRSRRTFNDMVRLDLKYINEWSLWLDLKILIKTPWIMLTGSGGY
jgi:lipopolysaccharide/colanic/teichoic acid biosynthesis glycosyltransferase